MGGRLNPRDIDRNLQSALAQVKKAATIIAYLHSFARNATIPHELGSINHVIRSAVSLMEAQLQLGEIEVTEDCSPCDPLVMGNAIHLEQVPAPIPKAMQTRIFDPFFTTKDVGKGAGLGLSIGYGIIQEPRGRMTVESEPEKGTTFTIRCGGRQVMRRLWMMYRSDDCERM